MKIFKNFNLRKLLLLSLFFSWINFPLFSSNEYKESDALTEINSNYLKNTPNNEYIISSGDTLSISISDDYPELQTTTAVDGEGTIYIPILGRIYVKDLSVNELSKLINESISEEVRYPDVQISITGYRPVRIYLEGEVENPGIYTIPGAVNLDVLKDTPFENLNKKYFKNKSFLMQNENKISNKAYYFPTIFDAIQRAGGITKFSDLSQIQLIRVNQLSKGGGKKIATLNFEKVFKSGDNSQNLRIYDSDIIRIKKSPISNTNILKKAIRSNLNPKYVNIFVVGRVVDPGEKTMPRLGTLNDAIDFSGSKVFKGKIKFIRFNSDGSIDRRVFGYRRNSKRGSYKNPLLKDGDFIIVGESLLSTTTEVLNTITTPFRGIVSTYGLVKAINDF